MLDLLAELLSLVLWWHHDPEIDAVRGGIALIFLIVFVVLVVVLSGAIVALRHG